MKIDEKVLFSVSELHISTTDKLKEAKCSEGDCGGDGISKKTKKNT